MTNLLLEIGTEEIPAFYLAPAQQQLERGLKEELRQSRLDVESVYATGSPRRLVLSATGVSEKQKDEEKECLGPSEKIAFDSDGNPTKAALGFVKGQGMEVKDISVKETSKGKYISVTRFVPGEDAIKLLPQILIKVVSSITFPKSMHWTRRDFTFARPIRYLMALLGKEIIPLEICGIQSGRSVHGHPFLASEPFDIPEADFAAYKAGLREHFVIVDSEERKSTLLEKVGEAAGEGELASDETLVTEVSNLLQYPNAAAGRFDERFLDLPPEVLEAVLKKHQRYFPLYSPEGALLPNFAVVFDREDRFAEEIIEGNERVLHARLSDAEFYYKEDLKKSLENSVEDLEGILYLKGLGSLKEKVTRLQRYSAFLSDSLGLTAQEKEWAERAALLCKSDLTTGMVGEFTELQGVMGFRYALAQGESEGVACAIKEQYLPRSPQDPLPSEKAGAVLSIAEKFDSIAGCFLLGKEPTGSQDPYALRRQAYGTLRILLGWNFNLSFEDLIHQAVRTYPEGLFREGVEERIFRFFQERMIQMFLDEGISHDLIDATLAGGAAGLPAIRKRLDALCELRGEALWKSLVAAVERTSNILKKGCPETSVEPALFQQDEERELFKVFQQEGARISTILDEECFAEGGREFVTAFGAALHDYFDKVFVNVDEQAVRENRLALLRDINRIFTTRFADLAKVVVPGD